MTLAILGRPSSNLHLTVRIASCSIYKHTLFMSELFRTMHTFILVPMYDRGQDGTRE